MSAQRVGVCALLTLLLFVISMNLSRGPTSTTRISSQLSEQLGLVNTRWGSGGEASVLKEEVTELRKRVKDLERHLTLVRVQPAYNAAVGVSARPPVEATAVIATASHELAAATPATAVAVAATAVATTPAAPPGRQREAPRVPEGTVGLASWWSNQEVQVASGAWCRMTPPYAAPKPPLPEVAAPEDKPLLTSALAKKHASADNLLVATYVNFNRLDFAFTLVKQLVALGNNHYLIGALDEPALRGMQKRGVPTFFMDSGLTTNDYGWGTANFRKLGLVKAHAHACTCMHMCTCTCTHMHMHAHAHAHAYAYAHACMHRRSSCSTSPRRASTCSLWTPTPSCCATPSRTFATCRRLTSSRAPTT